MAADARQVAQRYFDALAEAKLQRPFNVRTRHAEPLTGDVAAQLERAAEA